MHERTDVIDMRARRFCMVAVLILVAAAALSVRPAHGATLPRRKASFSVSRIQATAKDKPKAQDPRIDVLNPNAAFVGATVSIAGVNFGPIQGQGVVTVNGTAATVSAWSDTGITVTVPAGAATTGVTVVTNAHGSSNGVPFEVLYTPVLTGMAPVVAGKPYSDGDHFVITGQHFRSARYGGWVSWAWVPCQIVSWSDTRIEAVIPLTARAGYVGVVQSGRSSNGLWQQFTPVLSGLSKSAVVVGDLVTVTGKDFGTTDERSQLKWNGVRIFAQTWSDTSITFKVPTGVGKGYVGVTRDNVGSNGKYLVAAPRLTSLSAKTGTPGSQLSIAGEGFGATQDTCKVTIGGVEVPVVSWSENLIVVTVTSEAKTGYVGVWRDWACSNGLWFLPAWPPRITSVSTTSAAVGDLITITGANFYAQSPGSKVTVNGMACQIVSWNMYQVVARIPVGATSGYVGVWNYGLVSNGVSLAIRP